MKTLPEMFRDAATAFGETVAVSVNGPGGSPVEETYAGLMRRGMAVAAALIEAGIKKGDRVGLFADHSIEWIVADWGIQFAGAITVPRGSDLTRVEAGYITEHAGITICFVANGGLREDLRTAGYNERVILLQGEGGDTLRGLEEMGLEMWRSAESAILGRIDSVQPEDTFTIIYTSGTTGMPKGVELSHANMFAQVRDQPIRIDREDRTVSILPIWHSYERVFQIIALTRGVPIHISSVRRFGEDMKRMRPTILAGAPRLLEGVHDRIQARVAEAPRGRQRLFRVAMTVSGWVREGTLQATGQWLDLNGRGWWSRLGLKIGGVGRVLLGMIPNAILDRVVLQKIRAGTGGCLKAVISGGGALQPHVDRFFLRLGIPVFEGYGLTETSPVVALRRWGSMVMGTVGAPYRHTDFRILDRETGDVIGSTLDGSGRGRVGEVAVRGPQVMKGYYRNPEATEAVLDGEGWFRTGDLGMITFNGTLRLVGRLKSTIVLLSGENVEPEPIERALGVSPLIETAVVLGQDRKWLGALIVPSAEGLRAAGWCDGDLGDLVGRADVEDRIRREIQDCVSAGTGFKQFERVRAFRLLGKSFEIGVELTPTFKLKRHVIEERFKEQIRDLFEGAKNS